jgi:hypothetical protein
MATLQALKTGVWRKSEFKRQMAKPKTVAIPESRRWVFVFAI